MEKRWRRVHTLVVIETAKVTYEVEAPFGYRIQSKKCESKVK
jgi:hypothetical protein